MHLSYGSLRGRNAGYPAPPAQTRTCGFPASGSSVVLASVISRYSRETLLFPTVRLACVFPVLHVRHKFPLRAAYFRQVLPPVHGFPTLRVLRLIRLPISIRQVFPFTVLLCLPARHSPHRLGSSLIPFPGFPFRVSTTVYPAIWLLSPAGANGASQVLRRVSSCMPRPEDSGGPSHPRLIG